MQYPGGKSSPGTYQRIINLIPPHRIYVEPFLGGGAVYRFKKLAEISFLIDKDPAVISNFAGSARANTFCSQGCALEALPAFAGVEDAFIYCDPPYHPESINFPSKYMFDLDAAGHARLLSIILNARAHVAISGYDHPLYTSTLQHWNRVDYLQITRSGKMHPESLWYNYPTPDHLHDHSYAGWTHIDRQRIRRKISRLFAKFDALPSYERLAVLSAIEEKYFRPTGQKITLCQDSCPPVYLKPLFRK